MVVSNLSNKVSGVYKIVNLINLKTYVGSSKDIKHRWKCHIRDLSLNRHHSFYLQNAWNKYGSDNFEFVIIETCDKNLNVSKEQYWINYIKPEYNILKVAGSSLGYKMTEEQKEKIKRSLLGKKQSKETIKKRVDNRKGYKHSTQTLNKISTSNSKPFSLDRRISTSRKRSLNRSILQINRQTGNIIKEWYSMVNITSETNFKRSNIQNNLSNLSESAYGFIWKYKNNI